MHRKELSAIFLASFVVPSLALQLRVKLIIGLSDDIVISTL